MRERFRRQLADRYKRALEEGSLTVAQIQQLIQQLQTALDRAKRSNRRVRIEGQEGSWSAEEIEDQISALRRVL